MNFLFNVGMGMCFGIGLILAAAFMHAALHMNLLN